MTDKEIIIDGSSSFTGAWFISNLCASHKISKVNYLLTKKNYSGLQRLRLNFISRNKKAICHNGIKFGSKQYLNLIAEKNNFILCIHGTHTKNYNSENEFSISNALKSNLNNIDKVFQILKNKKVKIILSDSIFQGNELNNCIGKYGISKKITNDLIYELSQKNKIPVSRIIIPNPWGELEERRFLSYLICTWEKNETPYIRFPYYVRDNIYIKNLGKIYSKLVLSNSSKIIYPTEFSVSNLQFAKFIKKNYEKYTNKIVQLDWNKKMHYTQPKVRVNGSLSKEPVVDFREYFKYYKINEN